MSKPSKVIFGSEVVIDLTQDTVVADKLLSGYTAHGADGETVTGTCTYDADTKDATANASEILDTKTAYKNGLKVTGEMPNRGAVTGTISNKIQTYTIQNGYHDGSGSVSIDSIEQAKLVSQNIRAGVTVLGVEGSMTGTEDVVAQTINTTPYKTQQTIVPDSSQGYNYLAQVTVAPITYTETANAAGGVTVTIGDDAPVSP